MSNEIQSKFTEVSQRITDAAVRSGRNSFAVNLVVVTKGQPAEKLLEVMKAGAQILGENYPEETHEKILQMEGKENQVSWHMIGHLQSRKIKFVVDHFSMIHSIDGDDTARELDAKLQQAGKRLPAMFEVNVSGEESKHGYPAWDHKGWLALVEQFTLLQKETPNLKFVGLMTMPPFSEEPEASRQYFEKCRELMGFYQSRTGSKIFNQLSMGTSLDYEVAIEEGATYVRIGEAIMGERV